jgi:GH15 family glucan-1,4-alpha-glucosidase
VTAIENYGLIGDTRTAALVGPDGAIDWMCVPRFDGDPLFGRLVGGHDAGLLRCGPHDTAPAVSRRYRPNTATLETTWSTDAGRLTLTDGMIADLDGRLLPSTMLVRRLSAEGGPVAAAIEVDPRLGRKRLAPRVNRWRETTVCSWGGTAISVRTSAPVAIEPGRNISVTVTRLNRSSL